MADHFDLVLRGGDVVDGTGGPRRRADVGVRDGRIVAVGDLAGAEAGETLDAAGLIVAPGFIDVHTHYDVQALWDATLDPSPLHGVTTVIGGNCGFSIAPLTPDDADYVMRMMARVEGMPLESLEAGPPWDWTAFGDWLSRLDGRLAVNAGFLAGHSTIRRLVMGDRAVGERASDDEIARMVELLEAAITDGALGFSSSLGEAHSDGDGKPVPSRSAAPEEFVALARAAGRFPGTTLGFIAAMGEFPADRIELMTEMSLAADRPLNWNLLGSLSPTEVYEQQLTACDHAAARGATVVALALPDLLRMRASRMLLGLPGWASVLGLPDAADRRAALADPETRERLTESLRSAGERGLEALTRWDLIEVAEGRDDESAAYAGVSIAEIARRRGCEPVDVLLDLVAPLDLPISMVFPSLTPTLGVSDEAWSRRAAVWNDPRVLLGGSDSGAHVDLMCHANYPTVVLGEMVRERGVFSLEQAVYRMTDMPARLLGLRDRGRVAEGWHADLVVFDPATVASLPAHAVADFPAGGVRLTAGSVGVAHVYVAGREIVRDGAMTGAIAGRVLRSGTDTDTVNVPGGER